MQIRRAAESESAELSALVIAAKRHWGYSDQQIDAWRAGLMVTARFLAAHPAFVAELDGRVVGFHALLPAESEWELVHLWVRPECLNRGFGRALLAHAQLTAADGGATRITIDADPNAEAFYLACRAIPVGAVAAPIPGFPDRIRPQLILPVAQSGIADRPAAR
jgi:GNAT superfamily N-acetyltransferase